MGKTDITLLISVVALALTIKELSAGTVSLGGGCNSNSDCDSSKGLICFQYTGISGLTCANSGECFCSLDKYWTGTTCATGTPYGASCTSNSDCNGQNLVGASTAQCTNSACACQSGYYKYSAYLCIESGGTTTQGNTCTMQSDCATNLKCDFCPGTGTGSQYCFYVSGSTKAKPGTMWIGMALILSSMIFTRQM